MAGRSSSRPDGAEPVKAEENKTAQGIPKFLVAKLREDSTALFGVSSSTFDGAFYGCTETEMTIEEARARIEGWLSGKEAI